MMYCTLKTASTRNLEPEKGSFVSGKSKVFYSPNVIVNLRNVAKYCEFNVLNIMQIRIKNDSHVSDIWIKFNRTKSNCLIICRTN